MSNNNITIEEVIERIKKEESLYICNIKDEEMYKIIEDIIQPTIEDIIKSPSKLNKIKTKILCKEDENILPISIEKNDSTFWKILCLSKVNIKNIENFCYKKKFICLTSDVYANMYKLKDHKEDLLSVKKIKKLDKSVKQHLVDMCKTCSIYGIPIDFLQDIQVIKEMQKEHFPEFYFMQDIKEKFPEQNNNIISNIVEAAIAKREKMNRKQMQSAIILDLYLKGQYPVESISQYIYQLLKLISKNEQ